MRPTRRFAVACLLTYLSLAAKPSFADQLADLVPDRAVIYLEISQPRAIIDGVLSDHTFRLLESLDRFDQLRQSPQYGKLRQGVESVEKELGMNWQDAVRQLTGGGSVVAVGDRQHILLIVRALDAGLLQRAHELLLRMIAEEAKEQSRPSPVKSREYMGTTAWSLGKDEYHAIVGDKLILSNSSDVLQAVLEIAGGMESKPLAQLDAWVEARARQPHNSVGWLFVNLAALRESGGSEQFMPERAPNAAVPILLGGLGHVLRQAKYVTAALVKDEASVGFQLAIPRTDSHWPAQFGGVYSSDGGEAAEALRPRGMLAVISFYRDFKAMWDARNELVADTGQADLSELESHVGPLLFGSRKFGTGVLGEFGPRFQIVVAEHRYDPAGPQPRVKLPAFALVAELAEPHDFADDLLVAFQTVIGLANLSLAQQNRPRLIQGSQQYKDSLIHTANFLTRNADPRQDLVLFNFSPSFTVSGRYLVLASTTSIVKDLIDSIGDTSAPPGTTRHNVLVVVDGQQLARLIEANKEVLILQNMEQNEHTRDQAESEVGFLIKLLGMLGEATMSWTAEPDSLHMDFDLQLIEW